MKKITLLLMLLFVTLVGYGQVLSTGFEDGLPPGWTITNNGNGLNNSWGVVTGASVANSGTAALVVQPELTTPGAPVEDWVITPLLNFTGLVNPLLTFYGRATPAGGTSRGSRLEIRVSTTNTNRASFSRPIKTYQDFNGSGSDNPINSSIGGYAQHEVNLLAYAGRNVVYVAFVMINEGTGKAWLLDDVEIAEDCPPADNQGVANVFATSTRATWRNPGNAAGFQLEVVLESATPTGVPTYTTTTTATTHEMINLQPNTRYKYYLRSSCGSNGLGKIWVGPFSFLTAPVPATLPYLDDFEGADVWRHANGTQPNKWFVGTAVNNGGTKALYISDHVSGATYHYNPDASSRTYTYRDIVIPAGINEISFAFDFQGVGQTTLDYMNFWSVPNTYMPVAGTALTAANSGGNSIAEVLNLTPTFTNKRYIINVSAYAGTTRRFVFEWVNNSSVQGQGPAAIDNINVEAITCSAPSNLRLTGTTTNSATIAWDASMSNPSSYDYYVSQTNTPPTATTPRSGNSTTTTATVIGLLPGTTNFIWVRANCGGTNGTSFWIGYIIAQTNQIPAVLPIDEGFEGTHNFQFSNDLQPNYWMVGTATSNRGTKSLYITNDAQANQYTITANSKVSAFRDFTIPANTFELNVQFDFKGMGQTNFDRMRVWLVPSTFVPLAGVDITTLNSGGIQIGLQNYSEIAGWRTYNNVVNVSAMANSNRRIIFEWVNNNTTGNQPPAAIDNVIINAITCSAPSNIVLNSVGQTVADLSWAPPVNIGNVESYDYYVSTSNVNPLGSTTPTGNTPTNNVALSQLTLATQYYFWVRTNCGSTDGTSFWIGPFPFSTTQIPATLPYNETFDNPGFVFGFNNGDQTNKWMVGTGTFFSPSNSLYISNNDQDNQYTVTTTSVTHAYRDVVVPAGTSPLNLNFVFKGEGETTVDFMKVWIVPVTYNLTPGIPITAAASNGIQVGGIVNRTSTYQAINREIVLPATLTDQTVKLVFEWVNNSTSGVQPPASVDNISLKVLTCKVPTNLAADASCFDGTGAMLSWTPGASETAWEYLVLPPNAPTPSAGNPVTERRFEHNGLLPTTEYTLWVRAICGGSAGASPWVSLSFTTTPGPIAEANPFCAGPQGIVFPNMNEEMVPPVVSAVPGDRFHCLVTTPYPVWYYLKVDVAGPLNFQIVQNTEFTNGQPTGTTLDVDYVAFGPFNSLSAACANIEIAPGYPNPDSIVVDCSYSSAAVENFNIPNAQPGQVYAILITNYGKRPGFIKLVQTNAGAPGAGTTDCDFLCEVDLGEDKVLCATEHVLNASIATLGNGEVNTIEWFFNDQLMDPLVYNGLNITVNQSGKYTVKIDRENCRGDEPITDEVNINFISPFSGTFANSIEVCDIGNDGEDLFDLNAFANQILAGTTGYKVTFHANQTDANAGFGILESPYLSGTSKIYVRVAYINGPGCPLVKEIDLNLKPTTTAGVEFEYPVPICVNGYSSLSPILSPDFGLGGVFSSSTGLDINSRTGEINLQTSKAGVYEVKYFYGEDLSVCREAASHVTTIRILDKIGFIIDGYCKEGTFTISANDILGTLNFETATFEWSSNVSSFDGPTAILDKVGTYLLTVTTAEGCIETAEIVITDIYCEIQKGISPNGDGLNDNFVLHNFNVQKIQIFNRYGKEVYSHGVGYTQQWHGQSNNGDLLPSGTYFYTIVTPFETFTGWIQLAREIN